MRKLVFICMYLSLTIPCAAGTIYVSVSAAGANDGSSWADAYNLLQDGLDDSDYGDDIWVAEGTYYPTSDYGLGIGDRGRHFRIVNGVAIFGGFPTGGSDFPGRNIELYETILSGDLLANDNPTTLVEDLHDDPTRADNCYHVFYHPDGLGLDPNAILNGFTITAGYADGPGNHFSGGGMYNWDSSSTITNCIFTGNSASGSGGGMYNWEDSSPTVTGCFFSGNSAGHGGGMINRSSSLTVTNCAFNGNSAFGHGGGMHNYDSSPTVTGCTFTNNSAGTGGGMWNYSSSPTVTGCTFTGNSAASGGGMFNYNSSNPTVTNCTFTGNSADNYGGGMCNQEDSSSTVTNSILWGNTSASGGNEIALAALTYSSTIDIDYCDVQGGLAGIYDDGTGNTINWGAGNIDADPLFVDPNNGDYHLKSQSWRWDTTANEWTWDEVTSRCIDAGNPGALLGNEPMTLDVDPLNRWGENIRINMGAFGGTAQASMPPYDWALLADLTNDGIVNLEDFANQAKDWQNTADAQPGDLNRDGTVDLNDAILMANDWLHITTWH